MNLAITILVSLICFFGGVLVATVGALCFLGAYIIKSDDGAEIRAEGQKRHTEVIEELENIGDQLQSISMVAGGKETESPAEGVPAYRAAGDRVKETEDE